MAKKTRKRKNPDAYKFIVVAIFFVVILAIFIKAPNYQFDFIPKETIRLVYNTEELTQTLEKSIIRDEHGYIFLAMEDIKNIWDEDIYFDEENRQIVTSTDKKLATMVIGENKITINSSQIETEASVFEQEGTYYLPIQELQDVYNIEVKDIQQTNTITVDSLEERYLIANANKKIGIKWIEDVFSKNVDKVEKGEAIILDVTQDLNEKWLKVRTQRGKVGYVKKNQISNISTLREDLNSEKQIAGEIYLFIDEFASPANAPNRTGEPLDQKVNAVAPTLFRVQRSDSSNLRTNIGNAGTNYITWAHNQGYKVWPMITNTSMEETTANLLSSYSAREKMINDIVSAILSYELDGITLRLEGISEPDNYIKFISELSPRLKEMGKVFVVDLTKNDNVSAERVKKEADYLIQESYETSKMIVLQ